MKKTLCILLCAAMLLPCLAGCSREKEPYVPTGNGLTWDDPDYSVPQVTMPQEAEQELTLAYYPDKPMNPLKTIDFTNNVLFSLMYQGLFSVDRNNKVYPVLCKRFSVSDDMRTYIFYVENATFSDGSLLTLQDVYASLKHASESPIFKGRFAHVVKIAMTADDGIMVKVDTPCDSIPMLLTIPIIKESQIDDPNPLGTGPYYLESVAAGLRLRKRINWWCNAEMAVKASSIPLVEATSPAQIRDNFEFYDVGLVCADPCSDTYADFRCDYELWDCESGVFLYLGCNMGSELFSLPAVRSALTYAIDRDYLVSEYYRDFAKASTLAVSPGSPYYSRSLASRYSYDPAKFSQALSNAGLLGHTIRILVNKDDSMRLRTARAIGDMMDACGLIVTMKELNGYDYEESLLYRTYDIYVGQTRLSPNMDLSAFFRRGAALRWGDLPDATLYNFCLEALANEGNYYNLHKAVADDGRVTAVLFHSYAIYATRGLLTELDPSRDNVFFYKLNKDMEQILVEFKDPILAQDPNIDATVYVVTASGGLNMRVNPTTGSDFVIQIPFRSEVIPQRWENGWAYVEYAGYYGWVSGNYLAKKD